MNSHFQCQSRNPTPQSKLNELWNFKNFQNDSCDANAKFNFVSCESTELFSDGGELECGFLKSRPKAFPVGCYLATNISVPSCPKNVLSTLFDSKYNFASRMINLEDITQISKMIVLVEFSIFPLNFKARAVIFLFSKDVNWPRSWYN